MNEETSVVEERIEPVEVPTEKPASTRQRRPGITGAVILIGLGVALLLDNLGIVSVSWLEVVRYWPVLLILGGIDLMFGSRSIWGSIVAGIIAIIAIGTILFFSWSSGPGLKGNISGSTISGDIQEALGDAESLEVRLDIGAAQTTIGALKGSSDAVQGSYETDSRLGISADYQMRGKTGVLTITQADGNIGVPDPAPFIGKVDLLLSDAVPMSLDVNAGIGEITLNLSELILTSLTIDAGIGSTNVILPATGGYSVDISAGIGEVDITLPAGVEARVNFDGGLSELDTDSRFEKTGDGLWQTAGYATSDNRVELNIDAGLGSVKISQ